jgi:hypothetical protein
MTDTGTGQARAVQHVIDAATAAGATVWAVGAGTGSNLVEFGDLAELLTAARTVIADRTRDDDGTQPPLIVVVDEFDLIADPDLRQPAAAVVADGRAVDVVAILSADPVKLGTDDFRRRLLDGPASTGTTS